jgi:hypothetical protein
MYMRIINGRPLIEHQDYPAVVSEALHDSAGLSAEYLDEGQSFAWRKIAADGWGAIEDGFTIIGDEVLNPRGEAQLYMSPDQLELALIASGYMRLKQNNYLPDEKIYALDVALTELDRAKK